LEWNFDTDLILVSMIYTAIQKHIFIQSFVLTKVT
jgi:hypothetical protein